MQTTAGYDSSDDEETGSYELLKPHIVTPLPLQKTESTGEVLRLLCLLTGYPPLRIKWFFNGQLLKPSVDGRISFENNNRELVIKDLNILDGGSIVFQAENKYGEISTTCYLNVENKNDNKKTKKLKRHQSTTMKSRLSYALLKKGKSF